MSAYDVLVEMVRVFSESEDDQEISEMMAAADVTVVAERPMHPKAGDQYRTVGGIDYMFDGANWNWRVPPSPGEMK